MFSESKSNLQPLGCRQTDCCLDRSVQLVVIMPSTARLHTHPPALLQITGALDGHMTFCFGNNPHA